MRAARTAPLLNKMTQGWRPSANVLPISGKLKNNWGIHLGMLFLFGYAAGVLICQEQVSAVGQALAQYYMDKQNYTAFMEIYVAQFSALFLQAGIIVLCGSSILGNAFLILFFVGRGLILGVCASTVFLTYQARGLVVYWLLTFLPNVATLLLLLWLAQKAAELAGALLRAVLSSAASRGMFREKIKVLLIRYLLILVVGSCCSALGAAAAGLFARVLL